MSYIAKVEEWIADNKRKLEMAGDGKTAWCDELRKRISDNESLLRELRSKHKSREPGEEG